ncbi:hypothetical protein IWQ62_003188 [Dispira parvispora]|uniref:Fork-head domain-containing protein n=1 Tax=Dispira parvispora TaxID=1520584 RepID=A0A9W8E6S0_9FUNG|nr:hypothetical protein IWQ62_003188 [Dispira parvispora]
MESNSSGYYHQSHQGTGYTAVALENPYGGSTVQGSVNASGGTGAALPESSLPSTVTAPSTPLTPISTCTTAVTTPKSEKQETGTNAGSSSGTGGGNTAKSTNTNANGKPTISYANMITQAICSSPLNKLTLSSIYQWVESKYPYYRTAPPGWKNSIRHNLSLNKMFMRIPRAVDEPGKGSYWIINPHHIPDHQKSKNRYGRSTSDPHPYFAGYSLRSDFNDYMRRTAPMMPHSQFTSPTSVGLNTMYSPYMRFNSANTSPTYGSSPMMLPNNFGISSRGSVSALHSGFVGNTAGTYGSTGFHGSPSGYPPAVATTSGYSLTATHPHGSTTGSVANLVNPTSTVVYDQGGYHSVTTSPSQGFPSTAYHAASPTSTTATSSNNVVTAVTPTTGSPISASVGTPSRSGLLPGYMGAFPSAHTSPYAQHHALGQGSSDFSYMATPAQSYYHAPPTLDSDLPSQMLEQATSSTTSNTIEAAHGGSVCSSLTPGAYPPIQAATAPSSGNPFVPSSSDS